MSYLYSPSTAVIARVASEQLQQNDTKQRDKKTHPLPALLDAVTKQWKRLVVSTLSSVSCLVLREETYSGEQGYTRGRAMHSIYPSPCKDACALTVLDGYLIFGTLGGSVTAYRWIPSDDGIASFDPERGCIQLAESVPIDCVISPPSGNVIACLSGGTTIHFLALHSGERTETPFFELIGCVNLPHGCEYCSRSSAHCWLDKDSVIIGCFSGAVVCCPVPQCAPSSSKLPYVLAQEDAPIVQLFHCAAMPETLVISSLRRNCTCRVSCSSGDDSSSAGRWSMDGEVRQIGQKSREEGLFGACSSTKTSFLYAARHNHRVFEAQRDSGTVLKTFKVAEDTPLGLLRPLEASTLADDEVAFWSEGHDFCAVIVLSSSSECVWRYDTIDADTDPASQMLDDGGETNISVVGSAPAPHFQFALLSDLSLLVVPIDSAWDTDFVGLVREPLQCEDGAPECSPSPVVCNDDTPDAATSPNVGLELADAAPCSPNFLVDGQPVVSKLRTRKVSVIKKVSIIKKKRRPVEPEEIAKIEEPGAVEMDPPGNNDSPLASQDVDLPHEVDVNGPSCTADAPPSEVEPTEVQNENLTTQHSADEIVNPSDDVDGLTGYSGLDLVDHGSEVPCHVSAAEDPPPLTTQDTIGAIIMEEEEEDTREPEVFAGFRQDVVRLYRTYCARQLDKKAQPQLLAEILSLVATTQERMKEQIDSPRRNPRLSLAARNFFSNADDATTLMLLFRAGLEWSLHLPLPDDERLSNVHALYELMKCLRSSVEDPSSVSDDSDWNEVHEAIVKHLASFEVELGWLNQLSAETVCTLSPKSVLPRFNNENCKLSSLSRQAPQTALEVALIQLDPSAVQELQFSQAPACMIRQYFPYLFAVLPSKAFHLALGNYPTLNVAFLEWALSGAVQSCVIDALKCCGCSVERFSSDDLSDSLTDILLVLVHEHSTALHQSTWCFPRAVAILLKRRLELLDVNNACRLDPSVRAKKTKRIEDLVLQMVRECQVNINIAHPSLRKVFSDFEFPQGIVEIRAIEAAVTDSVASGRIDKLLPLFQLKNAINDGHWMTLFVACHGAQQLEAAMHLCFSVVQQAKKVRMLLRRAFPYMDTPELADEQLRSVSHKLAVLIGKS